MEGPPVPFIGFDPPDSPGRLASAVAEGGAGGVGGGAVPRPIEGVSIAFGQAWDVEEPVWQNLELIGALPMDFS